MEWKTVKNFPNYIVSDTGIVKNVMFNRVLTPRKREDGYYVVTLHTNIDLTKQIRVHRLVAEAFIPNPENLPCINHKDENKANNCVDNLEWCNHSYNNSYNDKSVKGAQKNYVKVDMYSLNDEYIQTFDSMKDAYEFLGILNSNKMSHISACCKGKKDNYKGYKWKFHDREGRGTKVEMYDKEWNYIRTFDTISDANEFLGVDRYSDAIHKCIYNKLQSAYGYYWKKKE